MYHPTALHILNLLKQHNFWYETFEHEPVITSVDAAKLRHGYTISQGAKALIAKVDFKDKKGEYVMFVLPGDARLDSKK